MSSLPRTGALVFCLLLVCVGTAIAADQTEFVTPEVQASVAKALRFIASTQNSDGSWGSSSYRGNPAITGLACMALMADGNFPGRGKYGKQVERAVKFIMNSVNPRTGFVGARTGAQMYGHGFATLCIAEAYGMVPSSDLEKKLRLAVKCIVNSQKSDGGWRYAPNPHGNSDLSVTVCQMMALRAANNSGVKVSKAVIDRAIAYTKKSATPDGGFSYTLSSRHSSFALTGAGVTVLYGAGDYDTKEAKKGLEYLKKHLSSHPGQGGYGHYFYGHYYAAQAMYQAGGEYWEFWYPRVRDDLLRAQLPNGSWQSGVGNVYGAAMGALVLQVPYNYLPIFQR